jgi:hypothetical protein
MILKYVKPAFQAGFTYSPSIETKAQFDDYFSKSKWRKSSMKQVSDIVRKFFEEYERSINASNSEGGSELIASRYGDSFMFAGPQGTQAVKKEDFLKALPKRQWFFKSIGLTSSTIRSLEETRLDDNYVMVKATWNMRFEKEAEQPVVAEVPATYILCQEESSLRIVFQLDHQNLMKTAQDLGLLPAKD